MSRALAGVALGILGSVLWSGTVAGDARRPLRRDGPIQTTDRLLRASLDRIAAKSALWREALDPLKGTDRRVVVLPADQVVVAESRGAMLTRPFDPQLLAEVAPVAGPDSRVNTVMVVVNLTLLEASHRSRRSLPWEIADDIDRIVVHEVYGHALPYLAAGDLSGHCPDPRPGERATDACAIRRENAVRAELGLGRRLDAGFEGLALARPIVR